LPKNIDVYVPAKAGGGTDVMARSLANQISKVAGSNLVILNNVDGNGVVSMETIRNAKPDGKTIMQFHTSMIILSAMGKYKYDTLDDFTVIAVGRNPVVSGYVLLVPPNAPYNNLKEFVEYAKKNPGKILAGVQTGGSTHLMMGMLEKAAGIKLRTVEAGSDTEKLTALAGNNINAACVNGNQAKQYIDAGKLKALGLISSDDKGARAEILPNVPSYFEQGYDVSYDTISFILGPKGMDRKLVEKLNAYYQKAATDKAVDEILAKAGFQLRFYGVDEGVKVLKAHSDQMTDAVNAIGLGKK
jgi:putative tricarboxylic transport membrane protein